MSQPSRPTSPHGFSDGSPEGRVTGPFASPDAGVRWQEGWWTTATSLAPEGLRLYRQRWSGAAPPRAAMVLVHGIGGHSAPFEELAQELVKLGLEVFAFDLPGHGRSEGPRGVVGSWNDYRRCLDRFLASEVAKDCPGRPCLLLGHSLGGALVLDAALDHQPEARPMLAGVVVSNPAVGATGVEPWRLLCARVLSRIWPTFTLSTGFPL